MLERREIILFTDRFLKENIAHLSNACWHFVRCICLQVRQTLRSIPVVFFFKSSFRCNCCWGFCVVKDHFSLRNCFAILTKSREKLRPLSENYWFSIRAALRKWVMFRKHSWWAIIQVWWHSPVETYSPA